MLLPVLDSPREAQVHAADFTPMANPEKGLGLHYTPFQIDNP
jgi:hypothetical protein